ncbi:hypothetical protein [Enterobacter hormaechei]|uniref:hypothetical protein n=1 Tax=Enterobacter hormaechei TaxID=158836 RepID=UPI000667454F|nr:hypothetical protein [Enterobacter hormaechei]HCM9300906.1 hypothetical protein [Enterobacter hormaechei subsp. xiangfangensis]EKX4902899.1 hypothetical protein [Enterobacter hormaechei]MCM8328927.1 hypothetical protein [Enterobacter hormaechei]MCM8343236.1 hypothetical protein [Enterobacter hormaechei]MCM8347885.1 hypothetical protein [Enterobacter hormaechei]
MIELKEVKKALSSIDEVTKLKDTDYGISFYYKEAFTDLRVHAKEPMISSRIEVSNSFQSPLDFNSVSDADGIAKVVNLTTATPCKTIFIGSKNSNGAFIIKNISSDKLDIFSEGSQNEDMRSNNLKLTIFKMMLENFACYKDLRVVVDNYKSGAQSEN